MQLFPNAFLEFSISRVPPPAVPFPALSLPFSRIRLRLCSFLPPRESAFSFKTRKYHPAPRPLRRLHLSFFCPFFHSYSTEPVLLAFLSFSILHASFPCLLPSFLFLSSSRQFLRFFPTASSFVYAPTDLGTKPRLLPRTSGAMRQTTRLATRDKSSKSTRTVDGETPSRIMYESCEIRARSLATNR